jgi:hypothetical protein
MFSIVPGLPLITSKFESAPYIVTVCAFSAKGAAINASNPAEVRIALPVAIVPRDHCLLIF